MKKKVIQLLRWSERYTKTDMLYIAKGSFWFAFGKGVILIAGVGKMILMGRLLSPETFGTLSYIWATIGILSIFSLPGVETAIVRSIARGYDGTLKKAQQLKMKWSLIGSLISLSGALWYFFQGNTTLGFAFIIGALIIPFVQTFSIFSSYWQGKKCFDTQHLYEMLISITITIITIATILVSQNILIILIASYLAQIGMSFFAFIRAQKSTTNTTIDHEGLKFGKHMTVMSSIFFIAAQIDKVILWFFLGPVSIAIYTFAQFPLLRLQALLPIVHIAYPKLSQIDHYTKKVKKNILNKFYILFLLFIPLSLVLIAIAPWLYGFIFPEYIEAIPYFQALCVLLFFTPFSLLETALTAQMKKRELYAIQIIPPTIRITLFVILTPIYGIWGLIMATIGTQLLNSLLVYYYFQKEKIVN